VLMSTQHDALPALADEDDGSSGCATVGDVEQGRCVLVGAVVAYTRFCHCRCVAIHFDNTRSSGSSFRMLGHRPVC
jgi:hypothetical protein